MQYEQVYDLPNQINRNTRPTNNAIQALMQRIYDDRSTEVAHLVLEEDEYSSSHSAYSSVKNAIASLDLPLQAFMRHGEIYVRRMD